MIEWMLLDLNFEVNRQEFVRSADGSPVGFDIVARRTGSADGTGPNEVAFIDVMPSDRVTVSDIITTLSATPLRALDSPRSSGGTFIVTEGIVDPIALEKAREFGVQIVGLSDLRRALGALAVAAPVVSTSAGRTARTGEVPVRRYRRRTWK